MQIPEDVESERAYKQVAVLESLIDERNGERIKGIVQSVAETYKDNPSSLLGYIRFGETHPLLDGIVSSAHYQLVKDISVLKSVPFGGFGAVISSSDRRMRFSGSQLWFAHALPHSLRQAVFSDDAGRDMIFSDDAGRNIHAHKNSLFKINARGTSLAGAEMFDNSGAYAVFSDGSGNCSKNHGDSLFCALLEDRAMREAYNTDRALFNCIARGYSLQNSLNKSDSLKGAQLYDFALHGSTNMHCSLRGAVCHDDGVLTDARGAINPLILEKVNDKLSEEEKENLVYDTIGKLFGVSTERIRQIERIAFRKIRRRLAFSLLLKSPYFASSFRAEDEITEEVRSNVNFSSYDILFSAGADTSIKPEDIKWHTRYPHYSTDRRLKDNNLGYSSERANLVSWFEEGFTSRMQWALRNKIFDREEV